MTEEKAPVVWLTGMPAAGKTTLARAIREGLLQRSRRSLLIDGDDMRSGVSKGLGFTEVDRSEAVRRAAHVARMASDNGLVAIAALVSPTDACREEARSICAGARFALVSVETPLWLCEQRDPKRLYAQARAGQVENMTGVQSGFEFPIHPEFIINTMTHSDPHVAAQRIIDWVLQ